MAANEGAGVKAAVFRANGRIAAEDWPRPSIGAGELLLHLRGCGLCGSDIAKIVSPDTKAPAVFGHELVGDVVEVGAGVRGIGRGDRVVAAHHVPCGECHYCRRGSESMCRAFKESHLDPGAFAEFARVPTTNVAHATFRLPEHVSDEAASFVEPLGCCVRATRRTGARAGDTAVVVGLGSIGCLFVQLLARTGATVVGMDASPGRVEIARGLGLPAMSMSEANTAIARLSGGRGADVVLITGGAASALGWAVTAVRDGGRIHYFAGGAPEAPPGGPRKRSHRELAIPPPHS